MGARKFVVFDVEAIGCLPFYVNKFKPTNSKCVTYLNDIVLLLNQGLQHKLAELGSGLKGSTFVTAKYYDYTSSLVTSPSNSGEQLFYLHKTSDTFDMMSFYRHTSFSIFFQLICGFD